MPDHEEEKLNERLTKAEEGRGSEASPTLNLSGTPGESEVSTLRVRATYGMILVLGFLLGLLLKIHGIHYLTKYAVKVGGCTTETCISDQGAYRVSFACFLFFLLHYCMSHKYNMCVSAAQRVAFNTSTAIIPRLVGFVILIVISFAIPNDFFGVYAWFCLVVSVLFLIGQLIILLGFAYAWNDNWGSREESSFQNALLVATVLMYILGITMVGLMYHWFGSDSSCETSQGMISFTLVMGVVYTFLSIWSEHGSLLPSAVVFLYTAWTTYSALSSGMEEGTTCNKIKTNETAKIFISAIFSCIALLVTATNAGASRDAFQISEEEEGVTEEEKESSNFAFFHFMMLMGSCYLAMLLTSWSVQGSDKVSTVDSGTAPMWAKFGSEIACVLLYVWTLAAPALFPDREF